MDMGNLSSQLKGILAQLQKLAAPVLRHHVVIAFVVVSGVLMYAVITVNQILSTPTDETYFAERSRDTIQTRFDDGTIQRIEQLGDRKQRPSLSLPGGRINPFVE
jgi:hypothetical protein